MSVVNEVIESVMDMIDATIELLDVKSEFGTIKRGALPVHAGISCEMGPSSPESIYMDKNTYTPLDMTINAKHSNLQTLSDTLNSIHSALTRSFTYPSDENGRWEILDITTGTLPQVIGREENNDWLMASSLRIKYYHKED